MLESDGGYAGTPNAFIFSLNNYERLAPFLSKVKPGKTHRTIERRSDIGPKFGSDLIINLDVKSRCQAYLGTQYSAPASVNDKDTVLKGPGRYFLPDEVEVFYVDPSC